MAVSKVPIIFILGLSGAGKSTLGRELQNRLDFLHIEQDIPNGGNGIDDWGFRAEWGARLEIGGAEKLADRLRSFALQHKKVGVAVTFDSLALPSIAEITHTKTAGINTIILYGTDQECLSSYLKRESANDDFGENHWNKYNLSSSEKFKKPEYGPYKLSSFENGEHKPVDSLIEELGTILK
jgi:hypothetical protein